MRETEFLFQSPRGKWKSEALLSSTIINIKNSSPISHFQGSTHLGASLGRRLDIAMIRRTRSLHLARAARRATRRGRSTATIAEALVTPVACVRRNSGPSPQEEQRVRVAMGLVMISPIARVPAAPNMYHQRRGILKARAKAKTLRAKIKARARAIILLVRDPGTCRFVIQRDIRRLFGVRGTAN